jgi:hypothetical protein
MKRRRLKLIAAGMALWGSFYWSMRKAVSMIAFYQTFDGRNHYSLEYWTVEHYCWAASAVVSFAGFLACAVMLFVDWVQKPESQSYGFPVR